MRRIGLRWLLLWPVLATVSAGFAIHSVYVYQSARADQVASVDVELGRVATRFDDGAPPRPSTDDDVVDDGSVEVLPDELTLDAPVQLVIGTDGSIEQRSGTNPFSIDEIERLRAQSGFGTVDTSPRYRTLVRPLPNGAQLVSALSLEQVDASLASLRSSLIVGGIVIFVFVGLVVTLIATIISRPVTRMSRAANKIAGGALDTPIDPPSGARETAALAVDLEEMVHLLTTSLDDSRRLADEATEARDVMQRFLADASHELRTPLTSLAGYSDLYAKNMLDQPGHLDRAMERVGSESMRLTKLVNQMLQLASNRPESDVGFTAVDVNDIVGDVVDDLRAAYPQHDIASHTADAANCVVSGDRSLLHQCILNLGANACQHGGAVTGIEIHVDASEDLVTVAVVDHGCGIDPALAGHLFEPFFRGDASRSRESSSGGAGLGLTIAQQIAEQHSGDITVTSTPGGGATFTLSLRRHASGGDEANRSRLDHVDPYP